MIDRTNVLTALGCSGSLLVTLALTQPAMAAPQAHAQIEAEQSHPVVVVTTSNRLDDALGCGCAVCAMKPIETGL